MCNKIDFFDLYLNIDINIKYSLNLMSIISYKITYIKKLDLLNLFLNNKITYHSLILFMINFNKKNHQLCLDILPLKYNY
jgi:hypothetical protein